MEKVKLEEALIEELSIILDAPVGVNTNLPGEVGLDSFGTMQIIVFLEDIYGVEVPEDKFDTDNFASVDVIMRWVLPMINATGSV